MRSAFTLSFSLVMLFVTAPLAAEAANSCDDPYWKDTLRCAFFPFDPPQPNFDTAPPNASEVKTFTRVFLDANPDVRCADGTAALMYIDKAVCTDPAGCGRGVRYGQSVESDRWMFTVPGGGSCHGTYCDDFYTDPGESNEMSSATDAPMKNMDGIHDPNPARNPVFAGYNRVRVEKCSYDRYMGRTEWVSDGGYYEGTDHRGQPIRFNLYHHGFLMMLETFQALENGLHYATWRVNPAGKVVPAREKLPPLADADAVLFVGHSGGSHGMFHNIDHLAAELRAMAGFSGDVRTVFDENFIPSIENEAAFASTAPPGSDAYSRITIGDSVAQGLPFSYDGASHFPTSIGAEQYDAWGAELDASCMQVHQGSGDGWKCVDRHHVVLNHISTPFFIKQDFTDSNPEHLDSGNGHQVKWAGEDNYPHCLPAEPCDPRMNAAEFRARLERQARTLLQFAANRSELGTGADRTFGGPGTFPTVYVWMPDCGTHASVYDDEAFYDTVISTPASSFSTRQWLEAFMTAPPLNVRQWQIDGATDVDGRPMRTAACRAGGTP